MCSDAGEFEKALSDCIFPYPPALLESDCPIGVYADSAVVATFVYALVDDVATNLFTPITSALLPVAKPRHIAPVAFILSSAKKKKYWCELWLFPRSPFRRFQDSYRAFAHKKLYASFDRPACSKPA